MFQSNQYAYSSLSTKRVDEPVDVESAFDFSSIYSFKYANQFDEKKSSAMTVETVSGKLIGYLILCFSYLFIFFTLPVSVWFCFKSLPQWERLVIYRLGKLHGVKGPGNVFTIPWLDCRSKLDLRTQLIQHPVKQFLTKDQSIVEAGCNIHYRICDPAQYVSNVRDPELKGLKLLVYAITYKKLESCNLKEMGAGKKVYIEDLALKEMNVVTAPWGVEISSVEIVDFRVLKEAEPVNGVLSVMKQLGMGAGSNEEPNQSFSNITPEAAFAMAAKGFQSLVSPTCLNLPGKSQYSVKLQEFVNSLVGKMEMEMVICFNVDQTEVFYVDLNQLSGTVYETSCPKDADVTLALTRDIFESLIYQRSTSNLLRSYLEGLITIDGSPKAIAQLQRFLSNFTRAIDC